MQQKQQYWSDHLSDIDMFADLTSCIPGKFDGLSDVDLFGGSTTCLLLCRFDDLSDVDFCDDSTSCILSCRWETAHAELKADHEELTEIYEHLSTNYYEMRENTDSLQSKYLKLFSQSMESKEEHRRMFKQLMSVQMVAWDLVNCAQRSQGSRPRFACSPSSGRLVDITQLQVWLACGSKPVAILFVVFF